MLFRSPGGGPGGPGGGQGGPGGGQGGPGGPGGFGGGPGGPGGPGGNPFSLDPLMGLDDPNRPLRSRLLKVPEYRKRYLELVRQIAEEDLAWENLGGVVSQVRTVIAPYVALDTRKMSSNEDFESTTRDGGEGEGPGMPFNMSLKEFAKKRREYLLAHPEIAGLAR